MAFDAELDELFVHTVTIVPQSSTDVDNQPTYGTAVSHRAKIALRTRYIRTASGREIAGRGTVYVVAASGATLSVPGAKDRLTMPTGFEPLIPPVLDVRPHYDEEGLHHVELVIG